MTNQLEYTPQGKAKGLPLWMDEWNYFGVTASEQLVAYPVQVNCPAGETGKGDQLATAKGVLFELRVRVKQEHFRASHRHVESEKEHLQLPCLVREKGCQTSSKTYVWQDTNGDCQLQHIRTISAYPNHIPQPDTGNMAGRSQPPPHYWSCSGGGRLAGCNSCGGVFMIPITRPIEPH